MIHDDSNDINIINNHHRYKDILGWLGTLFILFAYFLENIDYEKQIVIICLNLLGSFSVGYICYLQKVWQAFMLEVSWFLVSMYSLGKYII
jgi:hypothetical protein